MHRLVSRLIPHRYLWEIRKCWTLSLRPFSSPPTLLHSPSLYSPHPSPLEPRGPTPTSTPRCQSLHSVCGIIRTRSKHCTLGGGHMPLQCHQGSSSMYLQGVLMEWRGECSIGEDQSSFGAELPFVQALKLHKGTLGLRDPYVLCVGWT